MQFKVCGITNISQAQALDALAISFIGFIFYPNSKRYALRHMSLENIKEFKPANAKKVGVFVNEPIEQLLQIVTAAGIDLVQLHGDENLDYCSTIQKIVPVIKVFRVGAMPPVVQAFEQKVSYFLFDTDSQLYGGTGQHFNWELLKNTRFQNPYFLSGGIGPNDTQGIQIMQKTIAGKSLFALDLNSRFEASPGIKNIEQIKLFINANI